jgi:hypothetical protein
MQEVRTMYQVTSGIVALVGVLGLTLGLIIRAAAKNKTATTK